MKIENMDVLKTYVSAPPPENGGSSDSHTGLIKAFNSLDMKDDQHLLELDWKLGDKKPQSLNCTLDSSKDCVINNGCESIDTGDIKSESNMKVHVKSNMEELVEIQEITNPIKRDVSVVFNKESSGKMKSEEDLTAFFSELCLDKKSSCNVKCSLNGTCRSEDSGVKSSENFLSEEVPTQANFTLPNRENASDGRQDKHKSGNVLDEKVCELTTPDGSGVFFMKEHDSLSKKNASHFTFKKSEASSGSELQCSDSDESDDDLIERGPTKKSLNGEQKEKKIMSGRTHKATGDASKYQKSFPKLHMSGGSIVDTSQYKMLNATSGYLNLDSSVQSSNFMESIVEASSLPVCFDPNPINPVMQGSHIGNSYSFSTSCETDNFLDLYPLPASLPSSTSSMSSVEVQNQNTVSLEVKNQENSYQHIFDCLDVWNNPSPVSEVSSYPGQSSRSTSPETESGYGSSPGLSPFSDDGSEQCKYKNRHPSTSSASLLEICSPASSLLSSDEFIDNFDLSILDDIESTSHEIQPTDEETKKINEIKQFLKKCEEPCKTNDSDMVRSEQQGSLSTSLNILDSQNSLDICSNGSSPLQRNSTKMHAPHQQLSHANTPSAQVNTPPVLVFYVLPYAGNSASNGSNSKPFKPIEPDPEGQRLLARSPRECLKGKLDRRKYMHYLYRITEKLQTSNENVIYIENTETRQTNLHLAVIAQDLELVYCIMEVHRRKSNGDLSMVNLRDIYKKTALQYAVKNVMTVLVEYLKYYGAK